MKVFSNGTDTVVALDLADVAKVVEEQYGAPMEAEGWSLDEWHESGDETPITICNIDDNGPDNKETRTAREWADLNGRGLLCSTEW